MNRRGQCARFGTGAARGSPESAPVIGTLGDPLVPRAAPVLPPQDAISAQLHLGPRGIASFHLPPTRRTQSLAAAGRNLPLASVQLAVAGGPRGPGCTRGPQGLGAAVCCVCCVCCVCSGGPGGRLDDRGRRHPGLLPPSGLHQPRSKGLRSYSFPGCHRNFSSL